MRIARTLKSGSSVAAALLDDGLDRLGLDPGLGGVVDAAGKVAVGGDLDRSGKQTRDIRVPFAANRGAAPQPTPPRRRPRRRCRKPGSRSSTRPGCRAPVCRPTCQESTPSRGLSRSTHQPSAFAGCRTGHPLDRDRSRAAAVVVGQAHHRQPTGARPTPYSTSNRSPSCSVGSIERPLTWATPSLGSLILAPPGTVTADAVILSPATGAARRPFRRRANRSGRCALAWTQGRWAVG